MSAEDLILTAAEEIGRTAESQTRNGVHQWSTCNESVPMPGRSCVLSLTYLDASSIGLSTSFAAIMCQERVLGPEAAAGHCAEGAVDHRGVQRAGPLQLGVPKRGQAVMLSSATIQPSGRTSLLSQASDRYKHRQHR